MRAGRYGLASEFLGEPASTSTRRDNFGDLEDHRDDVDRGPGAGGVFDFEGSYPIDGTCTFEPDGEGDISLTGQ